MSGKSKWRISDTQDSGRQPSPRHSCPRKGRLLREGRKHVVMSDGNRFLSIPRNDPVDAYTMGGIVTDAGLDVEGFKKLL